MDFQSPFDFLRIYLSRTAIDDAMGRRPGGGLQGPSSWPAGPARSVDARRGGRPVAAFRPVGRRRPIIPRQHCARAYRPYPPSLGRTHARRHCPAVRALAEAISERRSGSRPTGRRTNGCSSGGSSGPNSIWCNRRNRSQRWRAFAASPARAICPAPSPHSPAKRPRPGGGETAIKGSPARTLPVLAGGKRRRLSGSRPARASPARP
jgi:hypothetical protein